MLIREYYHTVETKFGADPCVAFFNGEPSIREFAQSKYFLSNTGRVVSVHIGAWTWPSNPRLDTTFWDTNARNLRVHIQFPGGGPQVVVGGIHLLDAHHRGGKLEFNFDDSAGYEIKDSPLPTVSLRFDTYLPERMYHCVVRMK